jgi:hypothetical protein
MSGINIWAVFAAALANFLVGGLWYSPLLFGKIWMRENGFEDADLRRGSPAMIFGVALIFCLIMAANLAFFLSGPEVTPGFAVGAGIAAGLGWAALGLGVIALYERRSRSYILVHSGYLAVSYAAMGLILGLWR